MFFLFEEIRENCDALGDEMVTVRNEREEVAGLNDQDDEGLAG